MQSNATAIRSRPEGTSTRHAATAKASPLMALAVLSACGSSIPATRSGCPETTIDARRQTNPIGSYALRARSWMANSIFSEYRSGVRSAEYTTTSASN